ncbi:MAG: hypothetical protein IJP95_03200 [Bacteroidales bacterium]|nr:hypothetical protein [Bacteroidales bacterium]
MKKNYLKATVEVIEFRAEKGFANSYLTTTEAYRDGGSLSPSFTNSGNGNGDVDEGNFNGWDF